MCIEQKGLLKTASFLMWFSIWSGVTIPDAFSAYITMRLKASLTEPKRLQSFAKFLKTNFVVNPLTTKTRNMESGTLEII
jgi:hypothetical protein